MDPAVVTLLLLLLLLLLFPPLSNLHTKSLLTPSITIASAVLPYVAYLYSHCNLGWGRCVGDCYHCALQYSTVARGVSRGASQSLEGERARLIVISSTASFPHRRRRRRRRFWHEKKRRSKTSSFLFSFLALFLAMSGSTVINIYVTRRERKRE